ncbi:hypothetical protein OAE80_03940 [Planctomycetaceae bacterium]|jgi:hypothetical protein|nr:hypothetical protein [Planctomycetaceae bacterium]
MALVQLNWNPETRQLKQFGWFSLIMLPFLAWLWGATTFVIGICLGIGALFALLGMAVPNLLKPIFLGLSLVLMPIGLVVGEILMFLVFLLVFLTIGLVFRMMGRDRLQLSINRSQASYWQPKEIPSRKERYFRQY